MNSILKVLVILNVEGEVHLFLIRSIKTLCYFPSLFSVQPLLVFSARTVTERTALGTRQSVEADENVNGKIKQKKMLF